MSFHLSYCSRCGSRLEEHHAFCWNCGAPRQLPARPPQQPERPPANPEVVKQRISLVAFTSAAGAVFWLIVVTQTAAVFLNPVGRGQMRQVIATSPGVTKAMIDPLLVTYAVLLTVVLLLAAALHALAFYGLRRRRRAGWAVAVILAGGWSLLVIGIPFLVLLLRRDTRQAFGFS